MAENKRIPKAFVKLEQAQDCQWWILDCCPVCGEKHIHGGGPKGADPRDYLGRRSAHCSTGKPTEYVLVEKAQR